MVNSHFTGNRCDRTGPDLGGAALRVLNQHRGRPVYLVNSTFERGSCSNGGAVSSIGVSWVVLNCIMKNNEATGYGANPAKTGTPGGGSGGAIYTDGFHTRGLPGIFFLGARPPTVTASALG
ncbi:hypothetical protein [Allorhizocola rhizosphaerae]|uniref:hypothetical protein n=1 Tax=Allorhizocola rhizosphaerae TaxID=1872709 RepID=UPI00319E63EE